jgi:hypothetical protein
LENVIDVEAHRNFLEALISQYVDADLIVVQSKAEIDGKLGRGLWAGPNQKARIIIPKLISEDEAESCLLALAVSGEINDLPELCEDADSIEDGRRFLMHLVLHEIAHVKNRWGQDRESDCDVWAHQELIKIDASDT